MSGAQIKIPFTNQLKPCHKCGGIDKLKKHTDDFEYCIACFSRMRMNYTKVERRKNGKAAVA